MNKSSERIAAFAFGIVFVIVLLVLAVLHPNPTPFQYTVFRIVLALAAGGVAAMIPGFLTLTVSTLLRAGGALAVFAIVYFYSPAELTGVKVRTEQEIEIEKPVVGEAQGGTVGHFALLPAAFADEASPSGTVPVLTVTRAGDLESAGILAKRYQKISVDGVMAKMPSNATLVANEIEGIRSGGLAGTGFSIVARRVSNLTIDASGNGETGSVAGSMRMYVKVVENSRLLARGASGRLGRDGAAGQRGSDGNNGRNGSCAGFGGYRGADAGGNGGNGGDGEVGGPGGNGQNGGSISLTTIVNPVASVVEVSGGQGGLGGRGGAGGGAGRHGTGGRGCTGLGGSQSNASDGRDGLPGANGANGSPGTAGAAGDYRLVIVKTFDSVMSQLKTTANDRLHVELAGR
jgi:hypothetical protein